MMDRVVRVVRRALCMCAVVVFGLVPQIASANVLYVTPDGTGNGSSWGAAAGLAAALGRAQAEDTIRLKAGTYGVEADIQANGYTIGVPLTLEGGFAGVDDSTLADDPISLIDGAVTYPTGTSGLLNITATEGTVTMRRVGVAHSRYRGLNKASGAASLRLEMCKIVENGNATDRYTGRGAYLSGSTDSTEVTLVDCEVSGNGDNITSFGSGSNGNASGFGLYLENLKLVTLTSTDFISNGIPLAGGFGRDSTHGGAIFANSAPIVATDCDFLANGIVLHNGTNGDGGIVWIGGSCGETSFTRCRFVGNYARDWGGLSGSGGGVLSVSATGNVTVDRCTIAYNYAATALMCAAGLTVKNGNVAVRDSIFRCNACVPSATTARDIFVASGVCTVENTFLSEDSSASYASDAGSIKMAGVRFDDPLLATDDATFFASLVNNPAGYGKIANGSFFKSRKDALAMDAHLKSEGGRRQGDEWVTDEVTSPAVDAASRTAPFDSEPAPNGRRANLGGYSNTPEASKTIVGGTVGIDGAVTVDQEADWTNPSFAFRLTEGDACLIDVTLYAGTEDGDNGGTWQVVKTDAANYRPGDAVTISADHYFQKGDTIYWKIVVAGHDTGTDSRSGQFEMTSDLPPFWTAGGDSETVVHVWTDAPGDNDGTSWRHAYRTLEAGLAAMAADPTKVELWLAGEEFPLAQTVEIARPIVIRGGFDCSESAADERSGALRTTLDAGNAFGVMTVTAQPGEQVTLDALVLTHGNPRAITMTGGGDFVLVDVEIAGNGPVGKIIGRGIHFTGASGQGSITMTGGAFRNNRVTVSTGAVDAESGCAIYATGAAAVSVTGVEIVQNGFVIGCNSGRDRTNGAVIYVKDAPLTLANCHIAGNGVQIHGCGGAVYLDGNVGGSRVVNCSFSGHHGESYGSVGNKGEVLTVNASDASTEVTVENCTFAYNVSPMSAAATALTVLKGTVNVRNSIFWGNKANTAGGGAADLWAGADGTINVSYSFLEGDTALYVGKATGGVVSFGDGMVFAADPLFATPRSDFTSRLGDCNTAKTYSFASAKVGVIGPDWFDLHLKSTEGRWLAGEWTKDAELSGAIDKGASDSPYENEPEPNGWRVNMGAYGNTDEASKSPSAQPAFEDFTVITTEDYTQPHFRFTMGGEGEYSAALWVCYGTTEGGATPSDWEHAVQFGDVVRGQSLDVYPRRYFQPGEKVFWSVKAIAAYGSATESGVIESVEGELPPFFGKKGPDNVIHYREGAMGACSGSSWTDAFADFESAIQAVSEAKNELWIYGSAVRLGASLAKFAPGFDCTICGGFTEAYETLADELTGAPATLDANGHDNCLSVEVAAGRTLRIRNLRFTASQKQALVKTGAGTLALEGCLFENCGLKAGNTAIQGRGLNATGAGSTLTVSNCTFRNNVMMSEMNPSSAPSQSGCGIYASGIGRAEIVDTLFATNGVKMSATSLDGRDNTHGTALCLVNAPATVRGCAFIGNACPCHNHAKNDSGAIYVGGASDGTVFDHCRFVGNCSRYVATRADKRWGGGALMVALSGQTDTVTCTGCTFAYNYSDGGGWEYSASTNESAGAVLVVTGTFVADNSIFWGNFATTNAFTEGVAGDIRVCAGATAKLAYTLFADTTSDYINGQDGATIEIADTCVTGSPRFLTSAEDFASLLTRPEIVAPLVASTSKGVRYAAGCDPSVLDVHVKRRSAAIDAGDPAAEWRNELEPNGHRVNLGAYGNTPEAHHSPYGLLLMVK